MLPGEKLQMRHDASRGKIEGQVFLSSHRVFFYSSETNEQSAVDLAAIQSFSVDECKLSIVATTKTLIVKLADKEHVRLWNDKLATAIMANGKPTRPPPPPPPPQRLLVDRRVNVRLLDETWAGEPDEHLYWGADCKLNEYNFYSSGKLRNVSSTWDDKDDEPPLPDLVAPRDPKHDMCDLVGDSRAWLASAAIASTAAATPRSDDALPWDLLLSRGYDALRAKINVVLVPEN